MCPRQDRNLRSVNPMDFGVGTSVFNVAVSLTVRVSDKVAPMMAAHAVDSLPALRTLKMEGEPIDVPEHGLCGP